MNPVVKVGGFITRIFPEKPLLQALSISVVETTTAVLYNDNQTFQLKKVWAFGTKDFLWRDLRRIEGNLVHKNLLLFYMS